MSLDDPSSSTLKWGEPTLVTPSGVIGWSADLTGLIRGGGFSEADFAIEVEQAFERWEEVASIDFVEVPADEAVVTFAMQDLDDAAGLARVFFFETGEVDQIYRGDITLDGDRAWTPEGTIGGSDFFAVALHEIGHVLGLSHIDDPTAIMNPIIRTDDLGASDITAVRELYGEGDGSGPSSDPPPDDVIAAGPDEGGSSSAAALLVGLLAALVAMLFGGPGGATALIAAGKLEDDDDIPEVDPDELPPALLVQEHFIYLPEDGVEHPHGCGCGSCGGMTDDAAETFFV